MRGPVTARYATYAPQFPEQRRTAAQLAGLRFEAQVLDKLAEYCEKVERGPWLLYKADRCQGLCQPDALAWLAPKHLCIVECKLSWMRPARAKLIDFYGPVVQAIYPDVQLSYLQVYKNYKNGCHKKPLSLRDINLIEPWKYRECQFLPH